MEKVSFGYCNGEVRDLLGEDIVRYRQTINGVSNRHPEVKVNAVYSADSIDPRLNINLEGELGGLEQVMNELFEECGFPHVIDRPNTWFDKLAPKAVKPAELTTKEAYRLIRQMFKDRKIKLYGGYKNNTDRLSPSI